MAMIIIGGKEQARRQVFFKALEPYRNHPNLVVLCPEQYTVEMEQVVMDGLRLPGLLAIEVLSFKRLLHTIERKTPGPSRVLIDETGKTMLLRKALGYCLDQLTLFKPMINQGGFLKECAETIAYFKQHQMTPEELLTKEQELVLPNLLKLKLKEFGLAYLAYEAQLMGAYYDQEAYFLHMIQRLEESDLFSGMVLCIAGFTSFNQLELKLLKALAVRTEAIIVEIDGDGSGEANVMGYQLTQKTYNQLTEVLGKETVTTLVIEETLETEMDYLVRFFDRYPTVPYPQTTTAISIRGALNNEEEVEGVAVDLLKRIRLEGLKYRDVALLMEDLTAYASTVERIFQEYDIPYFLDFKQSALHHPLPCFILSLLRVVENKFELTDVMEHLKTGFYNISPADLGRFETIAVEEGLWGNDFLFLENDSLMAKPSVTIVWNLGLASLVAFSKSYGAQALCASERIDQLQSYFETCHIPEQLADRIQWLKSQGETRLAYEEAQIYNAVLSVLDQQKTLLEDMVLEGKAFLDILKVGLSGLELGTIPTQRDYVTIGNLERTRVTDLKHLYILGANEGVLPPVMKASNLFLNAEREKLKASGLALEGLESDLDEQASYNLLKALSAPSQGLTVSFTFSDPEGVARRKSMVVERITELFKDLEIKRFAPNKINADFKLKLRPAFRQGLSAIRERAQNNALTDKDFGLMRYAESLSGFESLTHYQKNVLLGKQDMETVGAENAARLYPQPLVASPTRLEKFVRCPFQHFAQYGLSPQLVRECGLEQLEIGNYHHQILDRFSKHLVESGQSWKSINDETITDFISAEESSFLTSKLKRLSKKKKAIAYALSRLNQVGIRALTTAKKQFDLGQFTQFASELSISRLDAQNSIPAIVITLEDGKRVYLEGKIDRVDVSDINGVYYARVIDYKTGQKSFDLGDVYSGTALQLTLYMGALAASSEAAFQRVIESAGLYYCRIDDPLVTVDSKMVVNQEQIESLIFEELKLSGMTLDEVSVLEAMDSTLFENGYSDFLPISLSKDSTKENLLFTKTAQVLSKADFQTVLGACKEKAREISTAIYAGDIEALPLQEKEQLSCDFCAYKALCGYDPRDPHARVKKFSRQDKEDILERMRQEVK
jgi:ATP-dependent helicase/nuclease subunit B